MYVLTNMSFESEGVDSARVSALYGGKNLLVLFHDVGKFVHQPASVSGIHLAPGSIVEGLLGSLDRFVDILCITLCNLKGVSECG